MNSCWNHEDPNRSPLERKIPVNSLFCKLFKHSFCFIVRQGSHLRLCGLAHTNNKTTTTRVQGEDISVTLRILSVQKGRWSSTLRAPRLPKVGGAAHAGCTLPGYHGDSEGANGDESIGVCVQLPTFGLFSQYSRGVASETTLIPFNIRVVSESLFSACMPLTVIVEFAGSQ